MDTMRLKSGTPPRNNYNYIRLQYKPPDEKKCIMLLCFFCLCRGAVDFLSNEGHIYSTIDENHFKSTDA